MRRIVLAILVIAATTAAKPPSGECSVEPNPVQMGQSFTVTATGLPIDRAINLRVTSQGILHGLRPLGSTPDGTFTLVVREPWSPGPWLYEFIGPIHQNPQSTKIYAPCPFTVVL